MRYKVSAADLKHLRLNEMDAAASALQNIAVILATRKGSVPLYRDFGLPWDFVDKPVPVAKAMMIAPLREAIETWEPRAAFIDVAFEEDPARPGMLNPIVEVEIGGAPA